MCGHAKLKQIFFPPKFWRAPLEELVIAGRTYKFSMKRVLNINNCKHGAVRDFKAIGLA